jgi:hypothetical protein
VNDNSGFRGKKIKSIGSTEFKESPSRRMGIGITQRKTMNHEARCGHVFDMVFEASAGAES